jgi:protein-S-isoprenylcysteine O-methyltransferase Ste14
MSANNSAQHSGKTGLSRVLINRFLQLAIAIVVQALILFGTAGSLRYPEGWAYLIQYVGFIILNAFLLLPGGKELIEERSRILENMRGWDRVVGVFYTIFGLGILVVAGLDWRFGWSPHLPFVAQAAGWIVMGLGYGLFSWAMYSNKFFSTVVRIQDERGHAVAIGGPYRFVRHPGYIGVIVYSLAAPVMFGALWAYFPAALLVVVIVVRTVLEDRTLRSELEGYAAYAQRVPYRLLPGVW